MGIHGKVWSKEKEVINDIIMILKEIILNVFCILINMPKLNYILENCIPYHEISYDAMLSMTNLPCNTPCSLPNSMVFASVFWEHALIHN